MTKSEAFVFAAQARVAVARTARQLADLCLKVEADALAGRPVSWSTTSASLLTERVYALRVFEAETETEAPENHDMHSCIEALLKGAE